MLLFKSSVDLLAGSSVLRGFLVIMQTTQLLYVLVSIGSESFVRDIGIPDRVCYHGKDEWTRDLTVEIAEPLAPVAAAKAADLKAAFAVPITHHHHFNGVLMLHARCEGRR